MRHQDATFSLKEQIKNLNQQTIETIKRTAYDMEIMSQRYVNEQIRTARNEMKKECEEKSKKTSRMLINIMQEKIAEEVDQRLQVPGLIGTDRKYATMATYLAKLDKRIEIDMHGMKNLTTELQTQINAHESLIMRESKKGDEYNKGTIAECARLANLNLSLSEKIDKNQSKIERLVKDSQRISDYDANRIKGVLRDWPAMKLKLENQAHEVFEEVVEHEMALAGLTNVNLEEMVPPPQSADMIQSRRSLLKRMTTIQTNLKQRMSGKLPSYETTRNLNAAAGSQLATPTLRERTTSQNEKVAVDEISS